jgi:hypothetical protein
MRAPRRLLLVLRPLLLLLLLEFVRVPLALDLVSLALVLAPPGPRRLVLLAVPALPAPARRAVR